MATSRGIELLTPSVMVASFLTGIAAAIGHHFFYQGLAGTEAPDGTYTVAGMSMTKQEVNLAAGTALAFIVKAAMVLTVAIAYTQLFWTFAKSASKTKGIKLSQLDATASARSNIVAFMKFPAFRSQPTLVLLALISWLLPLSAIVPPATLTVARKAVQPVPHELMQVPSLNFRTFKFSAPLSAMDNVDAEDLSSGMPTFSYDGPVLELRTITSNVVTLGNILPIPFGRANASWTNEFFGPALECTNGNQDLLQDIKVNIQQHFNSLSDNCEQAASYLSWWQRDSDTQPSLPYGINGTSDFSVGEVATNLTFYMALLPGMTDTKSDPGTVVPYACEFTDIETNVQFSNASVLVCSLRNATYHMDFSYANGVQSINVSTEKIGKPDDIKGVTYVYGPGGYGGINSDDTDDTSCLRLYDDYSSSQDSCTYDDSVLWRLAYQSTMDAFVSLVTGVVALNLEGTSTGAIARNTSLITTSLLQTKELTYLQPGTGVGGLQSLFWASEDPNQQGLSSQHDNNHIAPPLLETMEELFQNTTVSLMTDTSLWPNSSALFYPNPVNVSLETYRNEYVYTASKLWLAYGITVGVTFLSLLVGIFAILMNGASFSDNFSTIIRTTRYAPLSDDVRPEDCDGREPLPAHLKNSRIRFEPSDSGNSLAARGDSSEKTIAPTVALLGVE